jgi:hypothetical protein
LSDEVFQKLTTRASVLGTTPELLILETCESVAFEQSEIRQLSAAERQEELQATIERAVSLANRYPAGFEVDSRRDTIYGEVGVIRY